MSRALRLTTIPITAVLFAAATPAGQQPLSPPQAEPPATAFILGRTIDGSTGRPVGGAMVTLNSSAAPGPMAPTGPSAPIASALSRFPMRVVSDSNGAFVFRDLPKGTYILSATKAGYGPTALGRNSASDTGSQAVVLADGERRGNTNLSFWKYGSISGRVVDEAGEPVIGLQLRVFRRAVYGGRLRFSSAGNQPVTDDRGMYRISTLQPGDYVVGILTTQATMPTALQEEMVAAEKGGGGMEFRRELDRSGTGLGGVSALSSGQRVGAWLLQSTSELGGRGFANPTVEGARVFVYPTTYHEAATTLSAATIITVESGDDRTGVDFRIRPVPTWRVSGRLVGPDGDLPFTSLSLLPVSAEQAQRDTDMATATTFTDGSGAFTFLGVPPGEYTIRVLKIPPRPVTPSSMTTIIQTGTSTISSSIGGPSAPPPIGNDPTWWAEAPVSVRDSDVSGVTLTMRTGARVTGQLQFEGAAERPSADQLIMISVNLDQADARTGSFTQFTLLRGSVDSTGRFRTHQVPPGRYVIRASGATRWTFKSAHLGGRDVSDAAFEVGAEDIGNVILVFTDRPTELSGTTRDTKGPDPSATVVVFPAEAALWTDHGPAPRRFRAVRVGSDGSYRLANLPNGEYLAVAVRGGVPSDWMDPKFLQKLAPIASRVSLAEGDKRSQDLETREVRR